MRFKLFVLPLTAVFLLTGCTVTEPAPNPSTTFQATAETESPMGYTLPEPNTTAVTPLKDFENWEIVSYYGSVNTGHKGIDVLAPAGSEVISIGNGTVRTVGWKNGYGSRVLVDYPYKEQLVSITYGHLSKASLENIKPGDVLKTGDKVGEIAVAGEEPKVTVPRLHFEVSVQNGTVDSLVWLNNNIK